MPAALFQPRAWFLACCLCLLHLSPGAAFNLDVTETLSKDGPAGSLFGFSVALHRQIHPNPMSWLLVGAPQAEGLPKQEAKRTGGIYSCPLTSEIDDCQRVDIDDGVDESKESKENQWLGVSVKSQGAGGKIVACAHLYEARQRVLQPSETRDVIGRCYVLSEDLTISDEQDGGEWKFCEGRPPGHDHFGFCQQGASVGFTSDNHYIMMGAPGTYNWKGELRVELFNQTSIDLGNYDDGPYEVGGEKSQDARLIPLPSNSYLGFSIDSGKGVTRKHELSFVAGAPRANHTGAVVILRKDNANRLVPEFILWGENQLASSFGYSVAAVDVNSDGWTDLVVGSPYFFDRKEEIGGAAYVYINQAGKWGNVKPIRLNGTYDSMFGITVNSVDDLNQDGFKDIAIGAPFDGSGKVYIYHGSSLGIVTKPAQVLDGVGVGVKTFGYSIAGGLDIDGNSYPDLLVGSLSDTVVLYRSRPVLHLLKNVSVVPQNIDLEHKNCRHSHGTCVELKACFSYTANPSNYNPVVTLEYMFDADTERRKLGKTSRVSFLARRATDLDHQYSNVVELLRQGASSCIVATFQLQEDIKDKLRPIPVTLNYNIRNARQKRQAPAAELGPLMPVLNAQQSNIYKGEVNFLRQGCGEDKICQSHMQLHYEFCSRVGNSDRFVPMPRGEDGKAVFALTDQKDIALKIQVTNHPSDPLNPQRDGDDAHEALLVASFPEMLPYSAVRHSVMVCQSNTNGSQVECELGNPMKRGAEVTFYLIMSTSGITLETTDLQVDLQLSTISEQSNLKPVLAMAQVVIELPLSVSGVAMPNRLFFSGDIVGESAMKKEQDVGSLVEMEVTVSNRGQSLKTLGSAFLNLMWPHEISNGKWLLYPIKIQLEESQSSGRNTQCMPADAIDPLELASSASSRSRRDVSHVESDSGSHWPIAYSSRRKELTLDCARGTANCVVFQCPLHTFDRQVVLKIRARLWNSTFLEEYSTVSSMELIVRANITVKSSIKNLVLKDATAQIPIMIYSDPSTAEFAGVPWWIILVAVLAGILVLALLVLILWKCGFFKRARYEDDKVPKYNAVKIPRDERQLFKEEKTGTIHKKDWVTNWSENDGSVKGSA
ncbi:integrin alpha-7 isoform X1 [Ambystoma mexicanum]|uniref:integrin alpha-7 isoform X1 n=1 Tax=Ambystoma mexicanum TaxID=8296 RepID=UPI0037E97450